MFHFDLYRMSLTAHAFIDHCLSFHHKLSFIFLSSPLSLCQGAMSVDSISDMVESQSRLLEALQLSHPNELELKKAAGPTQAKLSLNPIYRQVPRVVERCCNHIETYGELQTALQHVVYFKTGTGS